MLLAALRFRLAIAAGADVDFELRNDGRHDHQLVLFRLSPGETAESFLAEAPVSPDPHFVGFSFAPPGGTHNLVVLDALPGLYLLVCYVTEPDGVAHVDRGMWAEFIVGET